MLKATKGRPKPPAGKHTATLIEIQEREPSAASAGGLGFVFEVAAGPNKGNRATRFTGPIDDWRPGDHLDKLVAEMLGRDLAPDEEFDFETLLNQQFDILTSKTGRVLKVEPVPAVKKS